MEAEGYMTTMRVNALAPMLIAQTLYDNLRQSTPKKLVAITGIMGSTSNAAGSKYACRASKAALNNGMRGLSRAWARDGILVALLNPGYVQTEMVKGQVGFISADECASVPYRWDRGAHAGHEWRFSGLSRCEDSLVNV
ncbi:SDR family NAD(P)-dependent oxidoreductase [Bradyrhizobium forestalis]|uniref:SDR family NAD(P)-dependent oxidoreductase n=1 Tax=Bradyrhizobium forestalis TaxID=1419263 RepID=UPI0024C0452D|nr:SDR family NAD(P)-dependent oxidoreductase [Bradyrhizobium forestalis]